MKKNQSGFGAVEGLLILIIVALIGSVGWYVWHSKENTDKTLGQASQTSSSQINSKVSSSQKYLNIKEWGVKLPLSSAIADAYYIASTNSEDASGKLNTMWLGLKSLDSSGCAAAQANTGGAYPLGAILKTMPDDTDPVSGSSTKEADPDGVSIGDYYYAYHSAVKGKTCAPQATLNNIDAAFKAAGKNIATE